MADPVPCDPLRIVCQGAIDELRGADDHVKGEPFSQGTAGGASQVDLIGLAGHRPSRATRSATRARIASRPNTTGSVSVKAWTASGSDSTSIVSRNRSSSPEG